jgi:23S rRNA pseudouridine2457 synthase
MFKSMVLMIRTIVKGEIGFNGTKYRTKCEASLRLLLWGQRKKNTGRTARTYFWASITVNEGKFRQIRKMTAAVGFP